MLCIHSPLEKTWQRTDFSIPVTIVANKFSLWFEVIVTSRNQWSLSPSIEFEEVLGGLLQMPFSWVK